MLEKTDECINSLRVASKDWPGFVHYQGLSTNTGLCSSSAIPSLQKSSDTPRQPKLTSTGRGLDDFSTPSERFEETTVAVKTHTSKSIHLPKRCCPTPNGNTLENMKENRENGAQDIEQEIVREDVQEHVQENGQDKCTKVDDGIDASSLHSNHSSPDAKSNPLRSSDSISSSEPSDSRSKSTEFEKQRGRPPLLSMTSISCNELPSESHSHESGVLPKHNNEMLFKRTACVMFPVPSQQLPSRPHTAGPRMIIPPKHTCPLGLTDDDFIKGQGFAGNKSQYNNNNNINDNRSDEDSRSMTADPSFGYCARGSIEPKRGHLSFNSENLPFSRCECDNVLPARKSDGGKGVRRILRPLTRGSAVEERVVSLELTITSIKKPSDTKEDIFDDGLEGPEIGDESAVLETQPTDKFRPADHANGTNSHDINNIVSRIDTIEDIKKSYKRAQSAPPTHRPIPIPAGRSPSDQTGSSDTKQFSNLYFRAKSAYHRRQDAATIDPSPEGGDRDARYLVQTPSTTKGSLLKPLLASSDSKSSKHATAGCPYKCKGCFKACLVSMDYVQKAVARNILEQQQQKEQRKMLRARSAASARGSNQSWSVASNRGQASVNIVSRALGRSQPLFHKVYGRHRSENDRLMVMRPWPTFGWVDLTARDK